MEGDEVEGDEVETAKETEGAARSVRFGVLGGAWDAPLAPCVFSVCVFVGGLCHTL